MVNGKKLLASVLVGAMVITGSPVAPAWSVATVKADEVPCSVTISGIGNTYTTIQSAVDAAPEGSVVTVTGNITEEKVDVAKKLTINITGAKYETAPEVMAAYGYCVNKDTTGVYVIGEHKIINHVFNWASDWESATCTLICENCGEQEPKVAEVVDKGTTATCTEAGIIKKEASYGDYTEVKEKSVEASKHDYQITYDWARLTGGSVKLDVNGKPLVKVTVSCSKDDKIEGDNKTHVEEVPATLVKNEATCNTAGLATYSFSYTYDGKDFSKEITLSSDATGKHIASDVPTGILYKKVTPATETEKEKIEWKSDFTEATPDEKGTITYKVVYKCKSCSANVEGIEETLSPKSNEKNACNIVTYTYGEISRNYKNTNNVTTTKVLLDKGKTKVDKSKAKHSSLIEGAKLSKAATCDEPGEEKGTCAVCGEKDATIEIPALGHVYSTGNAEGTDFGTEPAKCTEPGYTWKKCTREDCSSDGKAKQSTIPATGHNLEAVRNDFTVADTSIKPDGDKGDIKVTLSLYCYGCKEEVSMTYYSRKATEAELKSTDTNTVYNSVFEAFDVVEDKGDCLTSSSKTYTFKKLKKINGSAVSFKQTGAVGEHKYSATSTNWSKDGKNASATLECQNKTYKNDGTVDKTCNSRISKACKVTSVDNADGSTTYTATLEGYELTNNTKTVFDLSDAKVTVAEDIVKTYYESFYDDVFDGYETDAEGNIVYDPEGDPYPVYKKVFNDDKFAEALKANVIVNLNNVEINKDLYDINFNVVEDSETGEPKEVEITVIPNGKSKNVVGSKKADKSIKIVDDTVGVDYKAYINGEKIKDGYKYGKELAFTVTPSDSTYTVVYKVAKYDNESEKYVGTPTCNNDYDQTSAVLKDAGDYEVYWACKNKKGNFVGYGKQYVWISKVDPEIKVENVTVPYTGKAVEVSFDSDSNGKPHVTYTDSTGAVLAGAPVEIGKYRAVIWLEADDNHYSTDEFVGYITITEGNTEISVEDKTVTYTGKTVVSNPAKVVGSIKTPKYSYYADEGLVEEIDAPKNAGTYYVVATVDGDGNYKAAKSNVAKIVINKKPVTITLPAATNTTNALPSGYKATVTGVVAGDNLNVKPVLAGTTINATYTANANYDVKVVPGKLTVKAPKAQSISVKSTSKTYKVAAVKKAAKTFSIGATCTSKKAVTAKKVSGSKKITVSKDGKVKIAKGTKKGTYTAKVKLTAPKTSSYASKTRTVKVTVRVK